MYRTCSITLKEEYWSSVTWYKLATFDFPHVLLSGGRVWVDIPNACFMTALLTYCFQEVECDSTVLTPCLTTLFTYCFQEVECDSTVLTPCLTTLFTYCFQEVECDSTFLTPWFTTILLTYCFQEVECESTFLTSASWLHCSFTASRRSSVTRHS